MSYCCIRTSTWADNGTTDAVKQSVNLQPCHSRDSETMHEHERGTLMIMQGTLKNKMWLLLRSCIFMPVNHLAFGTLGDVQARGSSVAMWEQLPGGNAFRIMPSVRKRIEAIEDRRQSPFHEMCGLIVS